MTIIEFFARTKPISKTDRILMLGDLRGLACSPCWDAPKTPDDQFRRDAFERANIMLHGVSLLGGKIVWRLFVGPTIVIDDMDAQPLLWPRGGGSGR